MMLIILQVIRDNIIMNLCMEILQSANPNMNKKNKIIINKNK